MASTSVEPLSVQDALDVACTDHGIDPVAEPERATAIVADLVAAPGASSAERVRAVRSVLRSLARQRAVGPAIDREALVQDARRDGVAEGLAGTTVDTVLAVLEIGTEPRTNLRPRWSAVGGAAAVLVAVAIAVPLVTGDPSTDQAADEGTEVPGPRPPQSPTPTETSDADVPPRADLLASFAPVREGPFLVQRDWVVSNEREELVGTIRLTSADGKPTAVGHREIPPQGIAASGVTPTWSPPPTTMSGAVAVYAGVAVSGDEVFEFTYRLPLDLQGEEVEREDLLAWFEAWRPLAENVRSPLGDADPIEGPRITTLEEGPSD